MCSDQGAPGNHQLQAQRKEIRGLVAPSDPTPGSPPPHSSSQSPDCMKPPGAPEQRARLPGAVEPLSRQASLLHNANNQLSQDRELGPDLRSLTSVLHMWPKEAPRGLNRWDSTGPEPVPQLWQVLPALSLAHCRARCGRDYRLDVSPSGQDMTCGNKGAISSPPQAFSHEKAGRQSNSLEQFPRASQGSVSVTPAPGGAPDPGGSRNGPAPMPVRTPQVEPGPGGMWQQWALLWGQRGGLGPGYRVTAARAQERGRGAGTSSLDAARASERHREGSAGGAGRGSGPLGTCPEK